MVKDPIEPLAPVAPALKSRPFLWSKRWLDGPGRWSGRLLVLSPIPIGYILFYTYGFLQTRCGGEDETPCLAMARLFMGAVVFAFWCIAAACLATLALRVAKALRHSWRRVRARRRVESFSAECPNLTVDNLGPLRALLASHATGPSNESRARDAAFLVASMDWLMAAYGLIVLQLFLIEARADEGVHIHATYDGLLALFLLLGVICLVLLVAAIGRIWWRLRKTATELRLEQDITAERLEADLRRRNQGLEPERGPAALFQAFVPRAPSGAPQKH